MGASGSGSFENDTARDWLFEREESDDEADVRARSAPPHAGRDRRARLATPRAAGRGRTVAAAKGIALDELPDESRPASRSAATSSAKTASHSPYRPSCACNRLGAPRAVEEAGDSEWTDSVAGLQSRRASAGV